MDLGELKRLVDLIYDHSRMYRKFNPSEIVISVAGREYPGKPRPFVRIDRIEEGFDENSGLFFLIADEKIQRWKEPKPEPPPKPEKKPIEEYTEIDHANAEIKKLKREILRLRNKLLDNQPMEPRKSLKRKDDGAMEGSTDE